MSLPSVEATTQSSHSSMWAKRKLNTAYQTVRYYLS